MNLSWMAWTWPTALFFLAIALMLVAMTVWQIVAPSEERVGILAIPTTPGDRLFISLLGAAYIHLAWLGLIGPDLWWALVVSVLYAIAVFRLV
jgi:predicted small integral membrane protein